MYTCVKCGATVKTRQGLAGHHRFRHEGGGYPTNYRPATRAPGKQPATSDEVLELRKLVESLAKQVGQSIDGPLVRIENEVKQIKQHGESTEEKLDQLLEVQAAAAAARETQRRTAKEAETAEAWAKLWAEMAKLKESAGSYLDAMRRRADERGQMAALKEGLEMYLAELRGQSTVVSSPDVAADSEPNHDIRRLWTPMHEPDP